MLPNLFIAIGAPFDVHAAECENFGVRITSNDFFCT